MADDITIQIGARNRAKKVLNDVKQDVGTLSSRVKATTLSLKSMFGVIVGAGAAVGILRSITSEMERIDNIAKTSRKLGIATDDLIALRLAAAEMSGMAENQLDTALQRMTRRLADAADQTKDTALSMDGAVVKLSGVRKAISDLGLSVTELNSIGPAAAFRKIADAVKQLENPADQLLVAFKLFDSEGASLVNTLTAGSSALDEFTAKAKELNLTFSDEEAARIEKANDNILELTESVNGLKRELAISSAPFLTDAIKGAKDLRDLTRPIQRFFADIRRGYVATQVAQLDLMDRLFGGTGLPDVIGANGRMTPLQVYNNVIEESTGRPEQERLDQKRNELLKRFGDRDATAPPLPPPSVGRGETEMTFVSTHGTGSPTRNESPDIFDKVERTYDIFFSGIRQQGEIFAKQSRVLTGRSEQRRNIVVERLGKLNETMEAGLNKVAGAVEKTEGKLDLIIAGQPEFVEANVEVITQ